MQVILLERIGKLGNLGDVVKVKAGFGRNFLLPQGKAMRASKANMEAFEARRADLEAANAATRAEINKLGEKVDGAAVTLIRAASDAAALYGSVTTRDVAEALAEIGHTVNKNAVILDKPIKELGIHDIRISLHPEVLVTIKLNVARTAEEAAMQAEGKSIKALMADAESEAEAELNAMLDEVGAASADFKGDLART